MRLWKRMASATLLLSAWACGGDAAVETSESTSGSTSTVEVGAAPRGPSFREMLSPLDAHKSPEQLAEIARFIRRWEREPFAPVPENDTGMSTTAAMLAFVAESPDVHVRVCPILSLLAEREGQGGDPGPLLTPGSLFGMTAYLIEHPNADPVSAEVQVAGMESALLWYRASDDPATRNTFVDGLVQRSEHEGGLATWYAEREIRCGDGGAGPSEEHDHPGREEAGRVMRSVTEAVGACFDRGLEVQVRVVFTGNDGKAHVESVSGAQGAVVEPAAQACITQAIESRAAVTPFTQPEFRVNFPYLGAR